MTDKEKLHQILSSLWKNDDSVGKTYYNQVLQDVQTSIDLQEEPVSDTQSPVVFYGLTGSVGNTKEEPVSEDLEEASRNYTDSEEYGDDVYFSIKASFMAGAKWQKENLWKSADGDDLPEIDREVIVLIKYSAQRNIHDKEYFTYRVGFGHRPNPDGWDGKNIDTNEVTHYTPKLYDKGGWNAPDIAYWLDVKLPKEIEL